MSHTPLTSILTPVRLGVLMLGLSLAGCANYAGVHNDAQLRDAESIGLQPAQAPAETAPAIDAEWWKAFDDTQLNQLITQALDKNPSLKQAQARLQRARAVVDVNDAVDGPQVNASLDATRQRFSANGMYPAPLAGNIYDTATLQLGASWELDFFGKNSAALRAAVGTARAAEAETAAARVLLVSNVTRSYFQLLRLEDQQRVASRTLQQREEMLSLVRDRVRAGLDSQLELRQAEGALPEARQQSEALREQAMLVRHALGALIGQPQVDPVPQARPLAEVRTLPVTGAIPADLLGRRADVVAARWRVEAAGDEVRSAKGQFYPNVSLTAFAGYSSIGFDKLTDYSSRQWGVGPAIRLPIFEGGRLRANLRGRNADLDLAIESYNATILDAVRDAADQIGSLQSIARQQVEQQAAQDSAEKAYAIAHDRYEAGLGNYLQVLTAENAVLAQRRLSVDLAARALDTQAALQRALGGGYQAPKAAQESSAPHVMQTAAANSSTTH
jgi:NodT family efflux transporter outer membrane factor (OMF) lipoprotein